MKKSICGAAFLNLIFSVAAFAQDGEVLSGNDFYDACVSEGDTLQAFCAGYLIGFQEGRKYGTFLLMLQAADEGESTAEIDAASDQLVGNCIPKGVEFSQLKEIAVNYMRDHPESRHESARSQIFASFVEAYPCK